MPASLPVLHNRKTGSDVQSIDSAWSSGVDRYRSDVVVSCSLAPVAASVIALEQARRRACVQVRGIDRIYNDNAEASSRQSLVCRIPRGSAINALDQGGAGRIETVDQTGSGVNGRARFRIDRDQPSVWNCA